MKEKSKINTERYSDDRIVGALGYLVSERAQVTFFYDVLEKNWSVSWRLPELDIEEQPVVEYDDPPPKRYA